MPKAEREKRGPGRPCKLYSKVKGTLLGKMQEQVVHEAGLAFSLRSTGQMHLWEEYGGLLKLRGLHLIGKHVVLRCPPAVLPSARAQARNKAEEMRNFVVDEAWLRANFWVNGRDSKVHRLPLACNGHRLFEGNVETRELPQQFHLWVSFWRNPSISVTYSFGLGVMSSRALVASEEEPRVLALGLPDSTDAEQKKGLCIDVDRAADRNTFGPLGVFNGACKLHANCGIKILKAGDKGFPAWMDPDCKLAAMLLLEPVEKGVELLASYKLGPNDHCPLCE